MSVEGVCLAADAAARPHSAAAPLSFSFSRVRMHVRSAALTAPPPTDAPERCSVPAGAACVGSCHAMDGRASIVGRCSSFMRTVDKPGCCVAGSQRDLKLPCELRADCSSAVALRFGLDLTDDDGSHMKYEFT